MRFDYLPHLDQGALGAYTRVTYFNTKEAERKKSGQKVRRWELDR